MSGNTEHGNYYLAYHFLDWQALKQWNRQNHTDQDLNMQWCMFPDSWPST